jgi:hypothetical protein
MKIRSDESLSSWRVVRSSRRKSQQQQEKQLSSRMLRWMQRSMCLSAQTGKPYRSLSMVDGEGDQTQLREISEACLLNPSPDSDTLAPKDRTALLCYTLNRMPTRPDLVQATLSGHGHARTKAAPPSSSSFNLGVQRYLLIRHELLTLQYGHTSAKTHARTWPHRTGARSQARRASPTRPLVFVAPCPPPRRFVMSRPRRLAPSHLRPSL